MKKGDTLPCPKCGVAMNHHAEKLDFVTVLADPAAGDPDLGGVLQNAYACATCGNIELRRAG